MASTSRERLSLLELDGCSCTPEGSIVLAYVTHRSSGQARCVGCNRSVYWRKSYRPGISEATPGANEQYRYVDSPQERINVASSRER